MKKGKFIVIDGVDGSGKATQTSLLIKKLKEAGHKVKKIDFPRYYNNFFGKFIGECLVGEHGDFVRLDPRIASVLYAADRFESSSKISEWLNSGHIVIADRYTTSNQIHQGGKIHDEKKRKEFLTWIDKMEYEVFEIPRPDAIFYLDVPLDISMELLKNENNGDKKRYSKDKKDTVENSLKYLEDSKNSAIKISKENNTWVQINCVKNRKLMSIEEINDIIWDKFYNMFLKNENFS